MNHLIQTEQMRKILFCIVMLCPIFTYSQVLNGDLDGDGNIDVADVSRLVNVAMGKDAATKIDAYSVDNSSIIGTWYKSDGTSLAFNEDGTTSYSANYTYEFRPFQGTILIFNEGGIISKALGLLKYTPSYLLIVDYSTNTYTYYTKSTYMVSKINLSKSELSLKTGESAQLTATITPAEATTPTIEWGSSNEAVASVDQTGKVSALTGGTANIWVRAIDGSGVTANCTVKVTQLVTGITLSETSLEIEKDAYKKIVATVIPTNASNTKLTWTSSNTDVAQVASNGGVTAVGYGTATITATSTDGSNIVATCHVHVTTFYTINGKSYPMPEPIELYNGTKWASMNIGASSCTDPGVRFAFGETSPKDEYTRDNYSHVTYHEPENPNAEGEYPWISYNTDLPEDISGTSYDAATVLLGGHWRMPTLSDYEALMCYLLDDLDEGELPVIFSSYPLTKEQLEGNTRRIADGNLFFTSKKGNEFVMPYNIWYWGATRTTEFIVWHPRIEWDYAGSFCPSRHNYGRENINWISPYTYEYWLDDDLITSLLFYNDFYEGLYIRPIYVP